MQVCQCLGKVKVEAKAKAKAKDEMRGSDLCSTLTLTSACITCCSLLCGFGHNHFGKFGKQRFGFFPAKAGISDGNPMGERQALFPGLLAGI